MSNFGFSELRLVNPYGVAYHEAKSAVKAGHVLDASREFATVAEAVADCSLVVGTTALERRELQHPIRRLEYGGREIRKALASDAAVALMFGSEKYGLGNEDMSYCHWLMRIPARLEHGSMNLGQAVAVCLYELIRQPGRATTAPEPKEAVAGADIERLTDLLLDVLGKSGYVHGRAAESTLLKTRRLLRRMNLSAHDAEIWLGMLRQINWKLNA
jgi:tRNA/rRNA methyltransferase